MAQFLSKVDVHVIFSTENREDFPADETIRKAIHAHIAAILKEYDCPALLVEGMGDHIHILCTLSRKVTWPKLSEEGVRMGSSLFLTFLLLQGALANSRTAFD